MTNADPKAVTTTALVTLRMRTNADVEIQGNAAADFTLPKEQIGGRIYAVQLYHEDVDHKKKIKDTYFGAYSHSKLTGNVLRFEFSTPKIDIKKDETWLFVLYGAEDPSASGAPTYSPSPSASGSPSSSMMPSASPASSMLPPGSSLNALPSSPSPAAT